ncbi:MAG: AEC family transporter [Firmicutes bacterium]|nr:AEC family transporter [Bacillota bacterium]
MYTKFFQLFLLMAVGFGANKLKIFSKQTYPGLNRFISYVTFPCIVFANTSGLTLTGATLLHFAEVVVAQALFLALIIVLLHFYLKKRFARLSPDEASHILPPVEVSGTIPNNGFLGFPISLLFYGAEGLFFTIAMNVSMNAVLFSYGDLQYLPKEERANMPIGKAIRKGALHPISFGALLGVLVAAFHIRLPELLTGTISTVGSLCSPLAMIYIGSILADADIHLPKNEVRPLITGVSYKLFIAPLIALGLAFLLLRTGLWTPVIAKTFVLTATMPTVAYSLVFAEQHNGNVRLAGWAILASTVLSIATIPLWHELLERILF